MGNCKSAGVTDPRDHNKGTANLNRHGSMLDRNESTCVNLKAEIPNIATYEVCSPHGGALEMCAAVFENITGRTAMLMDTGANTSAILPEYEELLRDKYRGTTKVEACYKGTDEADRLSPPPGVKAPDNGTMRNGAYNCGARGSKKGVHHLVE